MVFHILVAVPPCQRSKIHRHTKNFPQKIPIPDQRFQHVHLDLIGPLPVCQNFRYCLTMIDRFSRWPEAIPLIEISADSLPTLLIVSVSELLHIIQLPTEFLKDGIVPCFKEDLQASPAEMLYGTSMRIPGEFFIEEDLRLDSRRCC